MIGGNNVVLIVWSKYLEQYYFTIELLPCHFCCETLILALRKQMFAMRLILVLMVVFMAVCCMIVHVQIWYNIFVEL